MEAAAGQEGEEEEEEEQQQELRDLAYVLPPPSLTHFSTLFLSHREHTDARSSRFTSNSLFYCAGFLIYVFVGVGFVRYKVFSNCFYVCV